MQNLKMVKIVVENLKEKEFHVNDSYCNEMIEVTEYY
jgi:hypothetical protein